MIQSIYNLRKRLNVKLALKNSANSNYVLKIGVAIKKNTWCTANTYIEK